MEVLETIKDEATGCTITLHPCADLEQPFTGDKSVIIAVLHRQYTNPAKGDLDTVEEIEEFEETNAGDKGEYVVFPLFLYDHSGTVYRASEGANPFSCRWDSGRVGVVALKRDVFDDLTLERANLIMETYTAWANGFGVGYVVTDSDGDEIDSCWGFYSQEEAEAAARENLPEAVPVLL